MAEGTDTYEALAVPLYGESEIKQTAGDEAVDILTLTGSTGTMTGDFLVAQSGAGTEVFVVSASGAITSAAGITLSGVSPFTAVLSSTAANAFSVSVTSTGAIAVGTATNSVLYVSASTKSVLNSIITYVSTSTGGEVGTCNTVLLTQGSKAPSFLISTGATAAGVGAVTTNGFVTAGLFLTSALGTTVPISAISVQLGSGTYYIPCLTTTTLAAS
jgi:hypothetical protein